MLRGLGIRLVVMPVSITCSDESEVCVCVCKCVWPALTHEKVENTRICEFQQTVVVFRVMFGDYVPTAIRIVQLPPESSKTISSSL